MEQHARYSVEHCSILLNIATLRCRFFKKKLGYIPEHDETLPYMRPDFEVLLPQAAATCVACPDRGELLNERLGWS